MQIQPAEADLAKQSDEWEARTTAAAVDAERKRKAWHQALEVRDALIVEGYDAHRTISHIARAAKVVKSRVEQVVAEWSAAEGRKSA